MDPRQIANLIERSSVGIASKEHAAWEEICQELHRHRWVHAGITRDEQSRRSGLDAQRIREIEIAAPPYPTDAELETYCKAIDLEPAGFLVRAALARSFE